MRVDWTSLAGKRKPHDDVATSRRKGRGLNSMLLICLAGFFALGCYPILLSSTAAQTVKNVADTVSAGYLVDYSNVTGKEIDDAVGLWIVPTITPSQNVTLVTESVGVGLQPGIQLGTVQLSENGVVRYHAFYTRDPEDSGGPVVIKQLDGAVGPGNITVAEIHWNSPGNWTIAILAGAYKSTSSSPFLLSVNHVDSRKTAEWYVEPVPDTQLSKFESVYFEGNATLNGLTYKLNDLPISRVRLYDPTFTCVLLDTSDIGTAGNDFTITYVLSAPPCPSQNVPPAPLNFPLILGIGGILVGAPGAIIAGFAIYRRKRPNTMKDQDRRAPESLVATNYCVACANILQPGARFCDRCGAPRQADH